MVWKESLFVEPLARLGKKQRQVDFITLKEGDRCHTCAKPFRVWGQNWVIIASTELFGGLWSDLLRHRILVFLYCSSSDVPSAFNTLL